MSSRLSSSASTCMTTDSVSRSVAIVNYIL
jgi:hypothetical protein